MDVYHTGIYSSHFLIIQILLYTGVKPLVPAELGAVNSEGPHQPVKVVYLLTVSGRASRQVYRLIKQVYSQDHYIFIHVDKRHEFMYRELEKLANMLPNLRMVKRRFSTIWGEASRLMMWFSAIQELLEMKDWPDWDFILNLSESHYPVKTQEELVSFLSSNKGNNFVKGNGRRDPGMLIKKQGLDETFYECDGRMWRLGPRKLPEGVEIDGGSDWICLSREFVTYVLHSQDELLVGLKKVYSLTLFALESFFHTVLRNSHLCTTYIDNNLHLTNWKRELGCSCQHKAVVDWCGCSPNDFLPEDWTILKSTRPEQIFFARKFEPIVHQGIINKVEEWSNNITIEESHSKHAYWQNVFHAADSKPAIDVSSLNNLMEEDVKDLATIEGRNLEFKSIETVSTYSFKDKFQGFLINSWVFDIFSGEEFLLEVHVKHRPRLTMVQGINTRLMHMAVGSEFDPKERIFRNYLNLLNQHSELTLAVAVSDGQTEMLKIGWFAPNLDLVAINQIQLNETSGIDSVVPTLETPLQAGIWTVVGVSKGHMVAKELFLVNPCHDVDNDITNNHEVLTNAELEQFVEEEKKSLVDVKKKPSDKKRYFYEFVDSCSEEGKEMIFSKIAKCSESVWSSHFSDPKSQISGIDPQTGELL